MQTKKIALGLGVVISFIAYSFGMRHQDETPAVHAASTGATLQASSSSASSTPNTAQPQQTATTGSSYKDGTYTGNAADAFYGNIQVEVTIANGKLTDVQFLQYPNDRGTSVMINRQAMPMLKQEALQAQTAHVDGVSGATDTSQAFIQSLSSALSQAS